MRQIFLNTNKQLRSGWKIGLVFSVSTITLMLLFSALNLFLTETQIFLTMGIIQSIVITLTVLLAWKLLDKKPLSLMGLPSIRVNYKQLLSGLLLGVFSISIVFIVLLMLGDIRLQNSLFHPNLHPSILFYLVLFIFVGFNEELFSRGYCMTVLKQTGKRWVVLFLPAALFSLLHMSNPNITLVGFINIFLIGLLFAYMFFRTGMIWMPIGYHITWNFFQGNVFGLEVSGLGLESLYNSKLITSNLLNGGLFGPEGGLLVTGIIILGFVCVHIITVGGRKSDFFN